MRRVLILAAFLLLAACGSSPKTNYFALTPEGGGAAPARIASPVQIVAVHIPPSLDRQEMVRMLAGEKVDVSDTDRWSAPLGEMIRNVLSRDLQARLPAGDVILPDAPAPQGTRTLVVTLTAFAAEADGRVTLSGSWSLVDDTSKGPRLHHDFDLHANGGSSGQDVAAGMSRSLGALANDIATTLASARA